MGKAKPASHTAKVCAQPFDNQQSYSGSAGVKFVSGSRVKFLPRKRGLLVCLCVSRLTFASLAPVCCVRDSVCHSARPMGQPPSCGS